MLKIDSGKLFIEHLIVISANQVNRMILDLITRVNTHWVQWAKWAVGKVWIFRPTFTAAAHYHHHQTQTDLSVRSFSFQLLIRIIPTSSSSPPPPILMAYHLYAYGAQRYHILTDKNCYKQAISSLRPYNLHKHGRIKLRFARFNFILRSYRATSYKRICICERLN